MDRRVIDSEKCVGCGKCVVDCVNQYIVLKQDGNVKKAGFKDRGRCLECGHCNAICPQGAISGGKAIFEIGESDYLLSMMAHKRSIRNYKKNSTIPHDVLEKIIFAAHTAPTDRNRRSARIILIKDILSEVYNKALDYLVVNVQKSGEINPLFVPTMTLNSKRDQILWNAEYLVVFVGLSESIIDASIASERMQLEAIQYGIGTAYRGDMKKAINNVPELREMLSIRNSEEVLISFAMGLTDLKYYRPSVKVNRKVEVR